MQDFKFQPWMRDPVAVVRCLTLSAADQWDNYMSPCSDPQEDIRGGSIQIGRQVRRLVMGRASLWAAMQNPVLLHCLVSDEHKLLDEVRVMSVAQFERICGALCETPEAGLLAPGCLTVCDEMGTDVLLMAGDDPADCYLIRGAVDATNTTRYGNTLQAA